MIYVKRSELCEPADLLRKKGYIIRADVKKLKFLQLTN